MRSTQRRDKPMQVCCPECGKQDVPANDITLELGITLKDEDSFYFNCPTCHDIIEKQPENKRVINVLRRGGVKVIYKSRHPENPPRISPNAPAITYDDLLDFHELLQKDNWLPEELRLPQKNKTPLQDRLNR